MQIFRIKTIIIGGMLPAALGWAAPVERSDLNNSLTPALCSPAPASPLLIPESQIEAQLIRGPQGSQQKLKKIASERAQTMAKSFHLGGFASGLCPDQDRAWAVAMPASAPPEINADKIHIPVAALAQRCRDWRVDYAPVAAQPSRRLPKAATIAVAGLKAGTISVTCQPKFPRWLGQQLWYLIPIGEKRIEISALPGKDLNEKLVRWINDVRRQAGYQPVLLTQIMSEHANLLSVGGRIAHNAAQLSRTKRVLKEGGGRTFLGENRVKGTSAEQMARLLWASPLHRDLILATDANEIGIASQRTSRQTLVVMTFARAQRPITAKRAGGQSAKGKKTQ